MSTDGQESVLELKSISVNFGGVAAVKDVSLAVSEAEILGLIGPNGAGKSTVLNVISGFIKAASGTVSFNARNIQSMSPSDRARLGMGRTFQTPRPFPGLTVYQNLQVTRRQRRGVKDALSAEDAMELTGTSRLADRRTERLRSGERRFVELARALMLQPKLLLLDEPATGLRSMETEALCHVLNVLRADHGIASLVVSHDMRLVNNCCALVVVMDQGQVVTTGTPLEVRRHPEVVKAYFGTDLSA